MKTSKERILTPDERVAISHLRGVQLLGNWLSNEMACSEPDEKDHEVEQANLNLLSNN